MSVLEGSSNNKCYFFTYRLARPEWASQRRLSNEKLSGLSLLGTVLSGEEETLRLKLDIDWEHPEQNRGNEYPFPWRPATGYPCTLKTGSRAAPRQSTASVRKGKARRMNTGCDRCGQSIRRN